MDDFTLQALTSVSAGAKAPTKSAKSALATLAFWSSAWPRRGRAAKDASVSDADALADALWLAAVASRDARLACIAPYTAPLVAAVEARDRNAASAALEALARAGAIAAEAERRAREARPMLTAPTTPAALPAATKPRANGASSTNA